MATKMTAKGVDREEHRAAAMVILAELDERLQRHSFLYGERLSLADMATAPFVRQFANTDREWFAAQGHPKLHQWLDHFLRSDLFLACMKKYDQWKSDDPGVPFPA